MNWQKKQIIQKNKLIKKDLMIKIHSKKIRNFGRRKLLLKIQELDRMIINILAKKT